MSVSIAQANAMLGGLSATLYVQAHTGDPGAAGTANTIGGSTRGTVSMALASGGTRSASGNSDCRSIPLGTTVTHVSYWDALTSGTFQFSEELASSVSFTYAGTLRLTTQTFSVSTTTGQSQTSTSVNADSTASSDSNVARFIANHTDGTSSSDVVGAAVGIFTSATDTTTSSESHGLVIGLAITDATTSSDSNAAGEADATAPTISSFTVPDTTGTSITGISASATDAVGVTGWLIVEQAADSGWSAPAASACSNTAGISGGSLSSSALTFTSSATETGTRYFRIYVRDAAGNVGASATDSATITIAASGITYVGAGTLTNASVGAAASFTASLPPGIAQNDILLLIVAGQDYAGWSDPTGWTLVAASFSATPWAGASVYWKRAGASETDPSMTNQANDGEGDVACTYARRIYAFRGCTASGSPLDTAEFGNQGTGATITGSTRTTVTNNAMMVMIGVASGAPVTTPGGSVDTVESGVVFLAYDDAPSNTAGSKSAPTATQTSAAWSVRTFALKPA